MRIGLITRLLWPRYGPFWEALFGHAGLETVTAPRDGLGRALRDVRLAAVPGVAFELAAAQALALHDADVLLAPELNPGEETARGSGQDPWIASFPDTLAKVMVGLPPVLGVPASLDAALESLAIGTLQTLIHDPALARRAWERSRALAKPPRYGEPRWTALGRETVGLVAQPWLLGDGIVERLGAWVGVEGRHLVSQHALNPAVLREEGRRVGERLIGSDREVLGAAHLMARKGSVARLVMLIDESSGADTLLRGRLERNLRKPLEIVSLQDLLGQTSLGQTAPGQARSSAATLLD